jgi:hypothetical protein
MRMRWLGASLLALLVGSISGPEAAAQIGTRGRFIICLPGGPGDTEMARQSMSTLGEALTPLLGRKISGDYTTSREVCMRALNNGPLFALVPLALYLSDGRKAGLVPVAQVVSPELGGESPRYHVMTLSPQITKLADLADKRLATGPIGDERYVRRVLFGGKLPATTKLEPRRSASAAVKAVARQQADAVLLDDTEWSQAQDYPGGKELKDVMATATQPLPPVLTSPGQLQAVRRALVALCKSTQEGMAACHETRLVSVTAASAADYAAAARAYSTP